MPIKVNDMFDSFPILSSDRFDLIEIKESHSQDIFELYSDIKVVEYVDILPLNDMNDADKEIKFYQNRYEKKEGIRWGISLKGSSEIIGTLGYNKIIAGHKARLGYDLKSKYWGNGYMAEALERIITFGFEKLSIHRIEAEVMQGNVGSEILLQKLNFKKEGVLRKWMFWDEKCFDITMFSLLKEEW